jgi:phenylpropionate dioxygenase-like ring-hydroxylating dioxygenase large terminal subunit
MAGMRETELAGLIRDDAVHTSVYTDPAIFDLEMERIFGRTWVYLAHAGEVAEPGDYRTTVIGRHPVIVTRLAKGSITALLNRCRHRGATLCQEELGSARFFRCAYHGWTYANDGRLVGVPLPTGYGESFQREQLSLTPIPRVAVYRGFIFGSLAPDGPTLEEHLGDAKAFLDEFCDVSPTGELSVFRGHQKCGYHGNWKFQMENGVDPYHVNYLHRSMIPEDAIKLYGEGLGTVIDLDGHGVADFRDSGPTRADGGLGGGFNLALFPNLVILRSQIRVIRPVAVDRTEIYTNVAKLQGVPDAVNLQRLRYQEFEFGAAGVIYADDLEIFDRVQAGLQASAVEWLVFRRGLGREKLRDGHLVSPVTDETQHRGFYRRWLREMTAGAERRTHAG